MTMRMRWIPWFTLAANVVTGFCFCPAADASSGSKGAGWSKEAFGEVEGKAVELYTLTNANGMELKAMTYGCIVQSLKAPDRDGNMADIVLGYDTLAEYVEASPYFGAVVGRYGNRIADGKFTLDGETYTLATNNEPNGVPCALHGGIKGFDKRVWTAEPLEEDGQVGVRFSYVSADGEEGYPGELSVSVTYWLTDANDWMIEYHATTTKPTPVNLTQHSYFNLGCHDSGKILDHMLMLNASHFTPVNKGLIPTGELRAVEGTPFDFTEPTEIGARIDADNRQLEYGGGYDHNWVLNKEGDDMTLAARVRDPQTGRVMEVHTEEPGIQFYSGNFLDGSNIGKGGAVYNHRNGFCLETQHYPDSPNHPEFPSTILRPGEEYDTTTVFKFLTE